LDGARYNRLDSGARVPAVWAAQSADAGNFHQ
jgi:hypothetical protein